MNATSRFPLLGEPLSLDLVNTRVRRDGVIVDLLDTPVALNAWLRAEAKRMSWTGSASMADWRRLRVMRDRYQASCTRLTAHELAHLRFVRWLHQTGRVIR